MSTLYLVSTPIGNMEDITLRALRILAEVRLVAVEDTRQTQKLFERHHLHTRMLSYHEFNKISRLDEILAALSDGDVALVSDAGTPGLNDPGYELVRAALEAGHAVSPVPGPSAPVAALVASGLATDAFVYLGYLPRKQSERRRLLEEVAAYPHTLVFLETPHRLGEALADLEAVLGDRPAVAARELTKVHEEILRLPLSGLRIHFDQVDPRGEFTLVVGGATPRRDMWDEQRLVSELRQGVKAGEAPGKLTERLARLSGWRKNQVYRLMLTIEGQI
jgi:16S rRNA (cytidine1402-2'-O)-methyltransferase